MAVACEESLETIGLRWLVAVNRRDADALIAISDPAIELRPTPIAGARRIYVGHDGLRDWLAELEASPISPQGRLREVRALDSWRVLVRCDVLVDGEPSGPLTLVARMGQSRLIVEARSYLTDEAGLMELGMLEG